MDSAEHMRAAEVLMEECHKVGYGLTSSAALAKATLAQAHIAAAAYLRSNTTGDSENR